MRRGSQLGLFWPSPSYQGFEVNAKISPANKTLVGEVWGCLRCVCAPRHHASYDLASNAPDAVDRLKSHQRV